MATVLKCLQLLLLIPSILGGSANVDLVFKRIEVYPEDNPIAKVQLNVEKTGRLSFAASGIVEILQDLDDKYQVRLDNYHNNHHILGVPYEAMGICKALRTMYVYSRVYDKLKEACVNAPDPYTCPLAATKLELTNYKVDLTRSEENLWRGYYRFELSVCEGADLIAKFVAHVEAN